MEHAESRPLRQLPVDLSEIDMIADIRFDEMPDPMVGYLDTQTGEVHSVYLDALRCAEEDDDPEELEDEAKEQMDLAIAIVEDKEDRYERIEEWESSAEFRLMEAFADATQTPSLRGQLFRALEGNKPFRRFKDVPSTGPRRGKPGSRSRSRRTATRCVSG
jgi:hypothetical protein